MTVPGPTWKVTSMTPRMEMGAGNLPVEGFQVNFETNQGIAGHVFVSRAQIGNREMITGLINDTVNSLHGIAGLTG